MFLGMAIFETLSEDGDLNSYIMTPSQPDARLIADDHRDVDHHALRGGIDIGHLRIYAAQEGVGFKFVASHLAGRAFERMGNQITLNLIHRDVPMPHNRAGSYGILLPKNFLGDARLRIRVSGSDQVEKGTLLTDTNQIFLRAGFGVWADARGGVVITVQARLVRGAASETEEKSTFAECLGGYIDGLLDSSVANLIRAINRTLSRETPQAFICHSSADKPLARRLAHALSGQRIRVWIDEAEIKPGDSLIERIETGILSSHNLIVIMTPKSVSSRWCKEELRMALALQIAGQGIRVLPALFEDCDIPGFLREKAYVDFRIEREFSSAVRQLADTIVASRY